MGFPTSTNILLVMVIPKFCRRGCKSLEMKFRTINGQLKGYLGSPFSCRKKVKAWKVCSPNFTKQLIVQVSPAPNDWNPLKSQSDPVELRCLIHEALSFLVSEHGKNHRSEGDYHHGAKPLIPIDMAMITMVLLVNTKTLPGCDGWPAASCNKVRPGGCSWGN